MLFTAPTLTDTDLALLEKIGEYRSRLRSQLHEPKRWTGSLRRLSFARNIQGSNSIEGFVAGLDDVDSARKYLSILAGLDFGYRDVAQRLDKLGSAKDKGADG